MFLFSWFVLFTREGVNSSIICSNIHSMHSLPDLHHQQWSPSVNADSTDIVRMALWECHLLFCTYWVAIHWLWIAASKSLTNYLIYKTKQSGGSIDAWGVAALTQTVLPIKAANTSIMGKCRSTALGLYKMQHPKSWMLCWPSFSDRGCDHVKIAFA